MNKIFDISKGEKIVFLFIFFHMLLGLLLSLINMPYYQGDYVREDGLIEWLTFDALLFGGPSSFYRIYLLRKQKDLLFLGILALTGIVFLFGAGEEISWGQRIFNIKSSEFFRAHNSQQETNLHNLIVSGVRINKVIFGTGLTIAVLCYTLLLPFLYHRYLPVKKLTDRLAIPIPKAFHLITYAFVGIVYLLIPSSKRGEMLEFGGCWTFFMMFLYPKNKDIYE